MHSSQLAVYFGSETDDLYWDGKYSTSRFSALQKKLQTENQITALPLFFLKQTHSSTVFVLDQKKDFSEPLTLFHYEGDAIITREKNVGIGVVTADCLPVVLFDADNHAVGIIHAGWRGLSSRIISETISRLQSVFGSNPSALQVYLGPSASVCCYEVQPDFLSHFPKDAFDAGLIESRNQQLFFNARRAALLELADNNVSTAHIDLTQQVCTICTPHFCSVRKQKEKAGRQPSVVFLK